MNRMNLWVTSALFAGVLGAACGIESAQEEPITWEAYRALAAQTFEGQTIYVVDGDIAVTEEELAARYEQYLEYRGVDGTEVATTSQGLTVNRVRGRDDLWSPRRARNLTYCVSNEFGRQKNRMISEMREAAEDWERSANVNFIYDSSQDGNCTGSNRNVLFAVRPWNGGGACAFFPSGGGCVPRTVVMNLNAFNGNPVTTVGVMKHELGHVLGLRHEHVREPSGVCAEGGSFRGVTRYDSASVMHYPSCNGSNRGDLLLTGRDRTGISRLYP